jgi:hypothetical protein
MSHFEASTLKTAAEEACKEKGLKYLWHGIIIDPQSANGVRYDVIGLKPGGGRKRFSLPAAQTRELTEILSKAFADDGEKEAAALPQVNKRNPLTR